MPTSPTLARTPLGESSSTRQSVQFRRDVNAEAGALPQGRREKSRGAIGPAQAVRGGGRRSRRARPVSADRMLGRPRAPREAKLRARDRGLGQSRGWGGMARPCTSGRGGEIGVAALQASAISMCAQFAEWRLLQWGKLEEECIGSHAYT